MDGANQVVEATSRCDPGVGGDPVGLTGLPDTIRGRQGFGSAFFVFGSTLTVICSLDLESMPVNLSEFLGQRS
jgi:hypothetical protein